MTELKSARGTGPVPQLASRSQLRRARRRRSLLRSVSWAGGLDRRLLEWVSGRDRPALNRTLVPLGRAADRSLLWMGAAALLAVAGGRNGRRAAIRGLVSIAVTSTLVNQPVKKLARRRRPHFVVPRGRFGRDPVSFSFPSGHSASAAAFATGVAQEMPVAGAGLALLAGGVAASRVYAGVHYPADVVVGIATGTAISLSLRRFWPVPERAGARLRPTYKGAEASVSQNGAGMVFVVNSSAGPAFAQSPLEEIQDAFPAASIEVVEDPASWDRALSLAAEAAVVGVAGGDGSVNAAAEVALSNDQPLVVVPAGTLNHLARDLGIDSVHDAVKALEQGTAAAVDVSTIDGKVFLNTASFGSYVELVDAREELEGRIGKWPAVVVALARVLRSSDPVEVEIDGSPRSLWMIFVGNCRYHPSGFAPSWRERLDDGLLDVRLVDAAQPWARARLLGAVLSGTLGRSRVYEQRLVREMRVRSLDGSRLRLARDGETFEGSVEFSISKLDRSLAIYVNLG